MKYSGETCYGTDITFVIPHNLRNLYGRRLSEAGPDETPVASAFTKRAWLVEVVYDRCRYVVSIKNTESDTAAGAAELANIRARRVFDGPSNQVLGTLNRSQVLTDSVDNRERLGVGGPVTKIRYENMRAA